MITYEKYGEALGLTREQFDELVKWTEDELNEGKYHGADNYDAELVNDSVDGIMGWFKEQHDTMFADPKYFSNRIGTEENPNDWNDEDTGVTGYTLRQQNVIDFAVMLDRGERFFAWAEGHAQGYDKHRAETLAAENSIPEVVEMKRKLRDESTKIADEAFLILFDGEDCGQTVSEIADVADNMSLAELIAMRDRSVKVLERAKEGKELRECFD
jgi:hypothetical protein